MIREARAPPSGVVPVITCEGAHVPGDVVAPADGLNPVHGAGVEPHQVSWTLDEAVDGHVVLVQVLQVRPPGTHQEVDVVPVERRRRIHASRPKFSWETYWEVTGDVLFTEVVDDAPVGFRDSEPLTVSRTDVDVHRAEVVVLLMTCRDQVLLSEEETATAAAVCSCVFVCACVCLCVLPGVRLPGTFM